MARRITLQTITNNFHAIVAGEAYRSAQSPADEIKLYRHDYGIKTIVNLLGGKPGDSLYDAEIAAARQLGIEHVDFPMSATVKLSTMQSMRLLNLLRTVRKPVLIHCKAGFDRTGLAAVLYLAGVTR